jgi:hypothetical protein
MSQLLAWQTMGRLEQDLSPVQPTLHELPAQFTPPRQLDAPHVTSQEAAPLQSMPPLQLLSAQVTRHGMPAGQCGVQAGVLH